MLDPDYPKVISHNAIEYPINSDGNTPKTKQWEYHWAVDLHVVGSNSIYTWICRMFSLRIVLRSNTPGATTAEYKEKPH